MKKQFALFAVIILGFPLVFGLSRVLETNKTVLAAEVEEQDLAFSGSMIKKGALGFDGLVADYYWLNALQYVGRKIVNHQGDIQIDNLRPLNPRLLYPYLDAATTLDPDFSAVYAYGSAVLPAIDAEQAIKISEKGIAAQPENWRMYHNLGFIYWRTENFKKAAEVYAAGAKKPNAPGWMREMSAKMEAEGGSRQTARAIYRQILESAEDEQTRELAALRLMQVDSLDERDAIRSALQNFQLKHNRCPANWREVIGFVEKSMPPYGDSVRRDAQSAPLDPSGAPYLLVNQNGKCDVDLDAKNSKVPYR